jgi:hypothetical protein
VQPVYQPPAAPPAPVEPSQPAATPKHITAPRAHHVKHRKASRPRAKAPVVAKPKRTALKAALPALLPAKISPAGGTGGGWADTAIGVGLAVLFVSAMFVATRRALRVHPGAAAGSTAGVLPGHGSHNGGHEHNGKHEAELPTLETLGFASMQEASTLPAAPARCTIGCWHGYVRSQFVAFEESEAGRAIIAESSPFRWRSSKPPPQTAEISVAHRELLAALTRLGWEAVESGPVWFEAELERAGIPIST